AMIVAQIILIFPIVCGLSYQAFYAKRLYLNDLFFSLQISRSKRIQTLIRETRPAIFAAIVTGLGRGLAEVGAVMIVGGNILHHTRTMTTAIALETAKGELITAVSLGLILLTIALLLNSGLAVINQRFGPRYA
ncbi:MAG: ABC transporter permease, partial [Gammaproteobacteria bacterium]